MNGPIKLAIILTLFAMLFTLVDAKAMSTGEEYVLIEQHTEVTRFRRDTGYEVSFPPQMEFSVTFRDKKISLLMSRNLHMTSTPEMFDENGKITHNSQRKIGLYQDVNNLASMLVQCEEWVNTCSLQGSMMIEGDVWKINRDEQTASSGLHRAQRSTDLNLALDIYNRKKRELNPETMKAVENGGDANTNVETIDDIKIRTKRAIPDCEIVEVYAFVDQSEWNFWLNWFGYNVTAAEEALRNYYMALYLDADLRFSMIPMQKPGFCIRIFFTGVFIAKNDADDWTKGAELYYNGYLYLDGVKAIYNCAALQERLRPSLWAFDHAQCFTRKDIAYEEEPGKFYAWHRSLAYFGTLCVTKWFPWYQVSILESTGDWVDLGIAHEIAHALGAKHDRDYFPECNDDDFFIMRRRYHDKPYYASELYNTWFFSDCSLQKMWWHIADNPNKCLRDHHFTMDEWWAQEEKPLPGKGYTLDEQCKIRYGLDSDYCDPDGEDKPFPNDMCLKGIGCTLEGVCNCTLRVFSGTPCGDSPKICFKGECISEPPSPPSSPPSSCPPVSPPSCPPCPPCPSSSEYSCYESESSLYDSSLYDSESSLYDSEL